MGMRPLTEINVPDQVNLIDLGFAVDGKQLSAIAGWSSINGRNVAQQCEKAKGQTARGCPHGTIVVFMRRSTLKTHLSRHEVRNLLNQSTCNTQNTEERKNSVAWQHKRKTS